MQQINKRQNKILFIIDESISFFVAWIFRLLEIVMPKKYAGRVTALKIHQQAIENVFGLTGLNALGGILLLFTQVKLANILGASLYGVYAYCLAIGEVGNMIVRYGRNKTMTRDLIQRPERRTFLIVNTFLLSFVNLLLFTIAVTCLHKPLDIELNWSHLLLIIAPCLISLDFQPVYESMRLMSWHSIYHLIQKVLFLLGIWSVIAIIGKPTLLDLGITLFGSWLVVLLIQIWEIRATINDDVKGLISLRNVGQLYRENFIIALSCLFGVAFGPLIRVILNQYADSASVGVYAAGMQLFMISQFILNQVGRVGNPMMAEVGKPECSPSKRRLFVRRYLLTMLACTAPFALPMLLFPQAIVSCIFTNEYAALGGYLPILALYLVALAIGVVFTQFLISVRKDKLYFTIYVSGALLTLLTAYLTIPQWGVLGAVISLCLPHGIACLGYGVASLKYLRHNEHQN